ncbi:hypothetical protein GIB67_014226 [Kingdonia uniflora]|uniref:Rad51-like C-terminal domain-containing protein n=1 Tax=Kingdonia uniflora TaxID=39325 RepID=A0A7J7M1V2_9MAGN|nr:hypothetical protein GIB67_014226 [Kingdonia uniflora]
MPPLRTLANDFLMLDSDFRQFCALHGIFSGHYQHVKFEEYPRIKSNGIYVIECLFLAVEDFIVHDIYVLVAFAERQPNSVELKKGITQVLSIIDSQHQPWLNGVELLEDARQNKHVLSTGCEGIDLLLQGGLRQGQVTELVGPSSSGKTQVRYCLRFYRAELWSQMLQISSNNQLPWLCIGDFNTVLRMSEKKGRKPPYRRAVAEFSDVINAAYLTESITSGIRRLKTAIKIWKIHVLDKFVRNKELEREILQLQIRQEDDETNDLLNLQMLNKSKELGRIEEEEDWRQRSRVKWLFAGDRNTFFFHHSTQIKRVKSSIMEIKDQNGEVLSNQNNIKDYILTYYEEKFARHDVCLQTTSNVAHKYMGEVMFLDTCNSFSSKRVVCFAQVNRGDGRLRLLVIDSISSLITPILGSGGAHVYLEEVLEGGGLLYKRGYWIGIAFSELAPTPQVNSRGGCGLGQSVGRGAVIVDEVLAEASVHLE